MYIYIIYDEKKAVFCCSSVNTHRMCWNFSGIPRDMAVALVTLLSILKTDYFKSSLCILDIDLSSYI